MRLTERCIYCDKPGKLTKEHIFGKWLKPHVRARNPQTTHETSFIATDPVTRQRVPSMGRGQTRNGPPHTVQFRLACQSCNGGMGILQEAAKPVLLRLLNGEWPEWDDDSLRLAASWAVMVTMAIDFMDPKTQTSTIEERRSLKDKLVPSEDNWQVYLGLCNATRDVGSFWHRAAHYSTEKVTEVVLEKKMNTQTTTFHFGKSFFHVLSGPLWIIPDPPTYAKRLGIRQIWPRSVKPNRPQVFSDDGVKRVAAAFWADRGINLSPNWG